MSENVYPSQGRYMCAPVACLSGLSMLSVSSSWVPPPVPLQPPSPNPENQLLLSQPSSLLPTGQASSDN